MKDIGLLFSYLQQPRRIVLLTHVRPDGDAVGSALALKMYFEQKGHIADVIVPDDFPDFLNWMHQSDKAFNHQKNPKTCFAVLTRADAIFFLDFNALKRIEALGEDVKKLNRPFVSVMIDHHREPDDFTDYALWNDKASSTAELVYDFIHMAGDANLINTDMAACIYAGMALDTGIFQFSNTTSRVHEIAAALMTTGINIEQIHNNVYNQYGENRMRFVGFLLSEKMVILNDYKAAYMSITMAEAEKYKLNNGDKEGIVNLPLAMRDVDIAVLFTEDRDKIKISFRSKGEVNVEFMARNFFNGGGHRNASGGSSRLSLEDTVKRFVEILPEFTEHQNKN
jgi:bifunctional oligoribonuclease and PAP phosphatase NrnA